MLKFTNSLHKKFGEVLEYGQVRFRRKSRSHKGLDDKRQKDRFADGTWTRDNYK